MATFEDDEYEIPLRDQRYFGAGLKRKRIQFVPSTTTTTSQSRGLPTTASKTVAERYLSIALKKAIPESPGLETSSDYGGHLRAPAEPQAHDALDLLGEETATIAQCDICHKPVAASDAQTQTSHERSITHQICLQHSHPPSHIDRTRKGLNVLSSQGWDPDTRLGLGAKGSEGRLYPVRAVENPNKSGLGARFDKVKVEAKAVKLDAGKARLSELEGKKRAEKLRDAFYRSDEVEKYLGEGQMHAELDLRAFARSRRGG